MLRRVVWWKSADFPEVFNTAIIQTFAMKIEAVRTSETMANFYEYTRRNVAEDRHLLTRSHENLNCHTVLLCNKKYRPHSYRQKLLIKRILKKKHKVKYFLK
jgi:hypothetical protein